MFTKETNIILLVALSLFFGVPLNAMQKSKNAKKPLPLNLSWHESDNSDNSNNNASDEEVVHSDSDKEEDNESWAHLSAKDDEEAHSNSDREQDEGLSNLEIKDDDEQNERVDQLFGVLKAASSGSRQQKTEEFDDSSQPKEPYQSIFVPPHVRQVPTQPIIPTQPRQNSPYEQSIANCRQAFENFYRQLSQLAQEFIAVQRSLNAQTADGYFKQFARNCKSSLHIANVLEAANNALQSAKAVDIQGHCVPTVQIQARDILISILRNPLLDDGTNIFHMACIAGDVHSFNLLRDRWDINFAANTNDEVSDLHYAILGESEYIVRKILETPCRPAIEFDSQHHFSPLHYAVLIRNNLMVQLLCNDMQRMLTYINAEDYHGYKPLSYALTLGDREIITCLQNAMRIANIPIITGVRSHGVDDISHSPAPSSHPSGSAQPAKKSNQKNERKPSSSTENNDSIAEAVEKVKIVYNTAKPFIKEAAPVVGPVIKSMLEEFFKHALHVHF